MFRRERNVYEENGQLIWTAQVKCYVGFPQMTSKAIMGVCKRSALSLRLIALSDGISHRDGKYPPTFYF